jgi:predicted lipoprotein
VDAIVEVLNGSDPIDGELLGAAQKGLPVVEYLLYERDIDVAQAFADTPRRGTYLVALANDLALRATLMREAWDPAVGNYLGELTGAGESSTTFGTVQIALSEIVNRMAFTAENIQAEKLGIPVGDAAGGNPQPESVESRFSGRAVQDIEDNLRGIELFYFGSGSPDSIGLDVYARERDPQFTDRMRTALDKARVDLDAIGMPLDEAVLAAPGLVHTAIASVGEIQRLIQVDIMGALGLTPSFNDNDGD